MRAMKWMPYAACVLAMAGAVGAQVADTPAGRQFTAWRAAQDSGDRAIIQQFIATNMPWASVEQELNIGRQTGGLDIRKVEESSDSTLVVLAQQRGAGRQFVRVTMNVAPNPPHTITGIRLQAAQPPPELAPPKIAPGGEAALIAEWRERLSKEAAADRFAGAVLLARNRKVLFSAPYGLADRERKIANTLNTRFRIGSMNKMFTAVAIMQLVERGKLELDEPLGKYLSDYPNQEVATKVTLRHLLTHTGGTGDIFGPDYQSRRLQLVTLQDYILLHGNRAPQFQPGSRYAYSNYGMLLLGRVIEAVSGQSYYDYVSEHVYKPAGMNSSGSEPESRAVRDRATGYMAGPGGGWQPNTDTLPYRGTSAGGGYSTVGDLMRFADALMSHKLLNATNTKLLIEGKVDTGLADRRYAFGFEDARTKQGDGSVGHSGGAPGMNGDLRIYPKSGYVVVVLSNLDPPAAQLASSFVNERLK